MIHGIFTGIFKSGFFPGSIDIAPGETCFIPRSAIHGFNNLKQEDAKALAVITPALLGPIYFKEIAEIINAGGPPDIEKIKLVMKKHGLVPAMPIMQSIQ